MCWMPGHHWTPPPLLFSGGLAFPTIHFTVQCTLKCTVYTTVYSVHYTVQCTPHYTVFTTPYSVDYTVQWELHCTVYTTLYNVHFTLAWLFLPLRAVIIGASLQAADSWLVELMSCQFRNSYCLCLIPFKFG